MRVRAHSSRILVGLVILAGSACTKAAEIATDQAQVADHAQVAVQQASTSRIRAQAPGTWACRDTRTEGRQRSDTTEGPRPDRLIVAVNADGTYSYAKSGGDPEKVQYSGDGNWGIANGVVEIRTTYDQSYVRGYRVGGVFDDATEIEQALVFRNNGSRVPDGTGGKVSVKIIDDAHLDFLFPRGSVWSCAKDAKESPATSAPHVTKTVPPQGELIGQVLLRGKDGSSATATPGTTPKIMASIEVQSTDERGSARYSPTVGADGSFSIEIPPGSYKVKGKSSGRSESNCVADDVRVNLNETTRITVTCTK